MVLPELIFDADPLLAFTRSHQLDLLDLLTADAHYRTTTRAVVDLAISPATGTNGITDLFGLDWLDLDLVNVGTSLDEYEAVDWWQRRLGVHRKEAFWQATVLARAENLLAAAVLDDGLAMQAGYANAVSRGVQVITSLGLLDRAVEMDEPLLSPSQAHDVYVRLRDEGGATFGDADPDLFQWLE